MIFLWDRGRTARCFRDKFCFIHPDLHPERLIQKTCFTIHRYIAVLWQLQCPGLLLRLICTVCATRRGVKGLKAPLLEKASACGSPCRGALGCTNNAAWQSQMACDSSDGVTELCQENRLFSPLYPADAGDTKAPLIPVCAFFLMDFFTCILVSDRGFRHC